MTNTNADRHRRRAGDRIDLGTESPAIARRVLVNYTVDSLILSKGVAGAATIQRWFASRNGSVPADLGIAIADEAAGLGVNADIVAAQCAHETGCWTSYAATQLNNPAGIGITNALPRDQWPGFPSLRAGIHAQVAHLGTYVLGRSNPWWNNDPRARFVAAANLGAVRTIGALGGTWAVPGRDYGPALVELANDLVSFTGSVQGEEPAMHDSIRGLIDIRNQLATNRNGGPGYGVPLSNKAGVIIHYSGPPVNLSRSDLDIIKGEAVYHVNKNWGTESNWQAGDGYMYHLCVGRNGEKWLCRDLEAALWHCGSWPENETWYAVHVPIGEGQRATPAQLQALGELVNDLLALNRLGIDRVKGHREVSSTACPGSLMADFVYPFRGGSFRADASVTAVDHARFDAPACHGEKWVIAPIYPRFADVPDPIPVLGYPITGMMVDGAGNEVQVFERAILRHIPGCWPEKHDVMLDLVGRMAAQIKGYVGMNCLPVHPAFQPAKPIPGQRYFEETQHNLGGGFRGYWERFGDLDLYGYPLSEEFNEDGVTVQYFERARFEWRQGSAPERFDVQLGLIGTEVHTALGGVS